MALVLQCESVSPPPGSVMFCDRQDIRPISQLGKLRQQGEGFGQVALCAPFFGTLLRLLSGPPRTSHHGGRFWLHGFGDLTPAVFSVGVDAAVLCRNHPGKGWAGEVWPAVGGWMGWPPEVRGTWVGLPGSSLLSAPSNLVMWRQVISLL